ncbi:MAG: tyrosine-type recombinase/integrase [bacterium]
MRHLCWCKCWCSFESVGVRAVALTEALVRSEKPAARRRRISDGGGLLLEIDPAGGKYWLWRHRYPPTKDGKQQDYRIGPYPRISLKSARSIRDAQRLKMLNDGINPCAAKRKEKLQRYQSNPAQTTFETVAIDWHSKRAAGAWSSRHASDVLLKLQKDILPVLGAVPIDEISTQDCLAVLRSIEKRGSLEQAKRTLGVISQVFDYGIALGFCKLNPAHSLKRHAPVKQVVEHFPCISWDEVPELLLAMEKNPGNADALTLGGLRLLMLTFVRTNELIGADWSEIDWEKKIWTIPAERMKGARGSRKEHLVPLSRQAMGILESLRRITGPEGYVFKSIRTSSGYVSNNTLNMALKRMGYDGRMCGHGFRALALTNIQEQLKIDLRIIDRQLAHVEKSKVTAAYNRAEYWQERVGMMQKWADLLDDQKPLGQQKTHPLAAVI